MAIVYAPNGSPYLITETNQGNAMAFETDALSRTGLTEAGSSYFQSTEGNLA
jgi:hypothetical protein